MAERHLAVEGNLSAPGARAGDLDSVSEDPHMHAAACVRVITMHEGIDHDLTDAHHRIGVVNSATCASGYGVLTLGHPLIDERHRAIDLLPQVPLDHRAPAPGRGADPPVVMHALNDRLREFVLRLRAKQEHRAASNGAFVQQAESSQHLEWLQGSAANARDT